MQGLTEFLPVSSSGHLVIAQALFGRQEPQLLFDVALHVGTLVAIGVVFKQDIIDLARAILGKTEGGSVERSSARRMLVALVAGCVPTAVIGIVFADQLKRLFASTTAAGVGLILTGLILMSTRFKGSASSDVDEGGAARISVGRALLIGTAQGLAICPGISRSGSTIAVALLLGVERELAARFSFLLAIPAVLGALVFELKDYTPPASGSPGGIGVGAMVIGAAVAAAVGVLALKLLLHFVRGGRLSAFAYYCWALGLLAIGHGILRG